MVMFPLLHLTSVMQCPVAFRERYNETLHMQVLACMYNYACRPEQLAAGANLLGHFQMLTAAVLNAERLLHQQLLQLDWWILQLDAEPRAQAF